MSDLQTLIRALRFRRTGATISIDDIRMELDMAQIPDSHRGGLFGEACHKGYLTATGQTVKTGHKAGKGRLVRTYLITGKARREAVDSRCDLLGHRATMDAATKTRPGTAGNSHRGATTRPKQEASSG